MKILHVCVTVPWSEIYAYQENLLPHYHRLMGHDAVILAVAHKEFLNMDVKNLIKENGVVYDVKGILPREIVDARL